MLVLNSYRVQLDVFIEEYTIIYEVGNIFEYSSPTNIEPVLYVALARQNRVEISFETEIH